MAELVGTATLESRRYQLKNIVGMLSIFVFVAGSVDACGLGSAPATPSGPTPTPLPLQIPDWQGLMVHTVCVEVEQFYPEIEDKSPEPIVEDVRGL